MEPIKISDLIKRLEDIKQQHGDLNICTSANHDYWGTIFSYLQEYDINVGDARPKGPKSGYSEEAVIFSS